MEEVFVEFAYNFSYNKIRKYRKEMSINSLYDPETGLPVNKEYPEYNLPEYRELDIER